MAHFVNILTNPSNTHSKKSGYWKTCDEITHFLYGTKPSCFVENFYKLFLKCNTNATLPIERNPFSAQN